jgi:hypothetical protein
MMREDDLFPPCSFHACTYIAYFLSFLTSTKASTIKERLLVEHPATVPTSICRE